MSDYYNPHKTFGLYVPGSPTPLKISRTKIDLFFKCPKCFYLDRVCGVAQPPGYPFSLNAAVDRLLKKEFDLHRPTNLIICGGIDDLWVNRAGEPMIVDYKATAKDSEVSLDAEWQGGYKLNELAVKR